MSNKPSSPPFYIAITLSDGLQVVDGKGLSLSRNLDDDRGYPDDPRLSGSYQTPGEAQRVINEITLSVLRAEVLPERRSYGGRSPGRRRGFEGF